MFVRRRKIVRTMLRAINDRPYKRNSSKRRRGDSIFRFASRHTCFASMRSPVKPNGKNKQNSGAPTPTHIVGTGVLDCPFRYESKFFPRRTVEDACPYRGLDDFRSFVRSRRMVRTMKRTVRQLVARTPCPYRGLDDFRLFVRRRKVVRTRRRTPHPSAFGCHLPPPGKALGKCGQRCGRSMIAPTGNDKVLLFL